MSLLHDFVGEFVGTFLLVFFGCGSVAVTVLYAAHMGLFQVAMVWGLDVTMAIYATRHLSCAHLNPAVRLAMVIGRRMSISNCLSISLPNSSARSLLPQRCISSLATP